MLFFHQETNCHEIRQMLLDEEEGFLFEAPQPKAKRSRLTERMNMF